MGLEIGINGVNKAITKVEFGVNSAWKEVNKSEIGINNAWKEGYVNIPGPSILIAGDTNAGYYGKAIGIITINDLISKTGVVEGTAQVSGDITWLKFAYQGKTLFVADRVLKCSLSWDDINAHDCVFGKIISLQKSYKCRLICGTEWNNLIVKFTPNNEDSHSSDHIFSWVQDTYYQISDERYCYGGGDATSMEHIYKGEIDTDVGWRPVLELL